MADPDLRLELAYDESVRALEQQANALDRLHTRAGLILSAAAITSSLFGAQVLQEGSLTCWSWAALLLFLGAAGAALYVLWPRQDWYFANRVPSMLKVWVDDETASLDKMRRELAEFNQENWDENQDRLGNLYVGFQVASILLAAEVVVWLIDLGGR